MVLGASSRLSLPQMCHQKFSKRRAVGSWSFLLVVVYTWFCQLTVFMSLGVVSMLTFPSEDYSVNREVLLIGENIVYPLVILNEALRQIHLVRCEGRPMADRDARSLKW